MKEESLVSNSFSAIPPVLSSTSSLPSSVLDSRNSSSQGPGQSTSSLTNAVKSGTSFEYDEQDTWNVGIGDLIIDLDADIEKTVCGGDSNMGAKTRDSASSSSSSSSSALHDKGLKMKIKRTCRAGGNSTDAKHEIVSSCSESVKTATSSQSSSSSSSPSPSSPVVVVSSAASSVSTSSIAAGPIIEASSVGSDASCEGADDSDQVVNSAGAANRRAAGSHRKEKRARETATLAVNIEVECATESRSDKVECAQLARCDGVGESGALTSENTDDSPVETKRPRKTESVEDMLEVCVGTDDMVSRGTSMDAGCLGPCEPGTTVTLEGIVWQETECGVLVVNVTWRGKTYVGTLLDCTRQQDWAPPRFNDSPTAELEMRSAKVRAKRGRNAASTANSSSSAAGCAGALAASLSDGGSATETRSSKLRATSSSGSHGKGRRSTVNSSGGAGTCSFTTPSSPARRKGRGAGSSSASVNADASSPASVKLAAIGSAETDSDAETSSATTTGNTLIECPEPNCSKKFRNANGLQYHQSHAHTQSNGVLAGVPVEDTGRCTPVLQSSPAEPLVASSDISKNEDPRTETSRGAGSAVLEEDCSLSPRQQKIDVNGSLSSNSHPMSTVDSSCSDRDVTATASIPVVASKCGQVEAMDTDSVNQPATMLSVAVDGASGAVNCPSAPQSGQDALPSDTVVSSSEHIPVVVKSSSGNALPNDNVSTDSCPEPLTAFPSAVDQLQSIKTTASAASATSPVFTACSAADATGSSLSISSAGRVVSPAYSDISDDSQSATECATVTGAALSVVSAANSQQQQTLHVLKDIKQISTVTTAGPTPPSTGSFYRHPFFQSSADTAVTASASASASSTVRKYPTSSSHGSTGQLPATQPPTTPSHPMNDISPPGLSAPVRPNVASAEFNGSRLPFYSYPFHLPPNSFAAAAAAAHVASVAGGPFGVSGLLEPKFRPMVSSAARSVNRQPPSSRSAQPSGNLSSPPPSAHAGRGIAHSPVTSAQLSQQHGLTRPQLPLPATSVSTTAAPIGLRDSPCVRPTASPLALQPPPFAGTAFGAPPPFAAGLPVPPPSSAYSSLLLGTPYHPRFSVVAEDLSRSSTGSGLYPPFTSSVDLPASTASSTGVSYHSRSPLAAAGIRREAPLSFGARSSPSADQQRGKRVVPTCSADNQRTAAGYPGSGAAVAHRHHLNHHQSQSASSSQHSAPSQVFR